MKSKLHFIIVLNLLLSILANGQQTLEADKYSSLPISEFFFPQSNLNKATYAYLDENGNTRPNSEWNLYYMKKVNQSLISNNKVSSKKINSAEIVDEQLRNSEVISSILKYLIVEENKIQIVGEKTLVSLLHKNDKTYKNSVLLLAKPISKDVASEWQREEDDGTIVTSVSSFIDYNNKGEIIPCIKVKETSVLKSANTNITKEYYYLYGMGLMASTIYNKTLKKFVYFDKISNLIHDSRLDEEESKPKESTFSISNTDESAEEDVEDKIYTVVEKQPEFKGGMAALAMYLGKNLRYPAAAQKNSISGRVFVSFIINKDGRVSDVKVLQGLGFGTDEEAIRVIESMPNWNPGKNRGKNVKVKYNFPINFTLE